MRARRSEDSFPRGEGERTADWGGDFQRKIRFIHTRSGDNVKKFVNVLTSLTRVEEDLSEKSFLVGFVVAGSCDQWTTPRFERSKLLIASIIHRRCLRLNWKAWSTSSVSGFWWIGISRITAKFFICFRLPWPNVYFLLSVRTHRATTNVFPPDLPFYFYYKRFFFFLCCFAFSPSVRTHKIFFDRENLDQLEFR